MTSGVGDLLFPLQTPPNWESDPMSGHWLEVMGSQRASLCSIGMTQPAHWATPDTSASTSIFHPSSSCSFLSRSQDRQIGTVQESIKSIQSRIRAQTVKAAGESLVSARQQFLDTDISGIACFQFTVLCSKICSSFTQLTPTINQRWSQEPWHSWA